MLFKVVVLSQKIDYLSPNKYIPYYIGIPEKNSDNVSLLVKEDKIVNFVQNIYATFHPLVYTVSVSVKSFRISFKNV